MRPWPRAGRASPHTRGWTHSSDAADHDVEGFPAHAGMDPSHSPRRRRTSRLPRTRGDGPGARTRLRLPVGASPHTRGWTPIGLAVVEGRRGFPAHAGMDPAPASCGRPQRGLPRTRGDGPGSIQWTVLSGEASPHTRGWTQPVEESLRRREGFPAHAGMDPKPDPHPLVLRRLPRTRGDGPPACVVGGIARRASPHTRGWTCGRARVQAPQRGFPAHAGMDPLSGGAGMNDRGFPAHAGMDPARE